MKDEDIVHARGNTWGNTEQGTGSGSCSWNISKNQPSSPFGFAIRAGLIVDIPREIEGWVIALQP